MGYMLEAKLSFTANPETEENQKLEAQKHIVHYLFHR